MNGAKETDALRSVIADVLAKADGEKIHAIVTEVVQHQLNEYDLKEIIRKALTPIVQSATEKILLDPVVMEALQSRVRGKVIEATQRLTIDFGRGY